MRLHPYMFRYNADFDGDQMAIHVPLSDEAQAEHVCCTCCSPYSYPRDGEPIVSPSQDMVIITT